MSNALLQACANGCIPIVKNISQNRDVITDENDFYLIIFMKFLIS